MINATNAVQTVEEAIEIVSELENSMDKAATSSSAAKAMRVKNG